MQRPEAAAVLGVDENATAAQARDRARQLERELSAKISSSPTPSLRTSHQHALQQLREAARTFGGESENGDADLPSSAPQPDTTPPDDDGDAAPTAGEP